MPDPSQSAPARPAACGPEPAPPGPGGAGRGGVPDGSRFAAALAYVPTLCFLPYFVTPGDPFALSHGRQAFLILFAAAVFGLAVRLLEWAVSPIPLLGTALQVLARLVFAVGLVLISGLGALRALSGERTSLAILARHADRLPF